MANEVHLFLATATALSGNPSEHPYGERHALLIFISQAPETDHDWERAELIANDSRWSNLEFTKAGTLSSENLNGKDQVFIDCYEDALLKGSAILVYEGKE